MKKQDDLLTKKYLRKELEKNNHGLKSWMQGKLDENNQGLKLWAQKKLDTNMGELKDWMDKKLDETFLKYRDEIMTRVDEWAGYAKKNYEETEVISHKITLHEERIEKLETAVLSN